MIFFKMLILGNYANTYNFYLYFVSSQILKHDILQLGTLEASFINEFLSDLNYKNCSNLKTYVVYERSSVHQKCMISKKIVI